MRKILLFLSFVLILSCLNACSSQNVKQNQEIGTVETPATGVKSQGSMDFRVVDESLNTVWVKSAPEKEGLEVFSGTIAVYGNEPFTYFVLYVNKKEKYGLIGTEKFIEYLKTHKGYLKVAGTVESEEKEKWIKVSYVIQEGEK